MVEIGPRRRTDTREGVARAAAGRSQRCSLTRERSQGGETVVEVFS
jgi:hypothetical protein